MLPRVSATVFTRYHWILTLCVAGLCACTTGSDGGNGDESAKGELSDEVAEHSDDELGAGVTAARDADASNDSSKSEEAESNEPAESAPDGGRVDTSDSGSNVGSNGTTGLGSERQPGVPAEAGAFVDGGMPVDFIDLRVEEITEARAVVRFDTSVETTCEVEWGLLADELDNTAVDPDMDPDNPYGLDHQVPLEDLPEDATIFYRAKATTRGGHTYYTQVDSFQTLAAAEVPERANVALASAGTTVVDKSSNYGGADDDGSWGAAAVIDGSMSTEWATSGDGDDAFVTLDLGQERLLVGWGFRSRKMTDGSSIIEASQLLLDGERTLGPFETPDPDQLYQFDFDEPVSATIVTVSAVQTTGGNTGAKEIELYVAD